MSAANTISIFLIVCLLSGCSTTSTGLSEYTPEALRAELEVGDRVEITTTDGGEYEFVIDALSEEAIIGQEAVIEFEEIKEIQMTRLADSGEVVTSLAGVVIVGAAIWYFIIVPIIALASLASLGG